MNISENSNTHDASVIDKKTTCQAQGKLLPFKKTVQNIHTLYYIRLKTVRKWRKICFFTIKAWTTKFQYKCILL